MKRHSNIARSDNARKQPTTRRWTAGLLVAASLLSAGLFTTPAAAEDPQDAKIVLASSVRLAETDIYEMALGFTCWVNVPQSDGSGRSMGTGWIVDKEQRLIITNHHVIDGGTGQRNDVQVWFPTEQDGELLNDHIYYEQNITPVRGTVIDSDSTKDLALIQLSSLPESVTQPAIAKSSPRPGEHIHTVAGLAQGSQALWVYTTGVVKSVYKKRTILADNQIVFARVVEAQADVNKGNSGGPVLNDRGEVVAVISSGAVNANSVESFIDQEEIHGYLETVLPLVDPQTSDAFNVRATRHYYEGRYDQAIDDFNAALRMDSENGKAFSGRAWAQMQNGELQIALGDFTDAIQHNPTMTDAYHGRGMVNRMLDNVEASLTDLSEAIRRDNGSDTLYNLYNERGITHFWHADYANALKDFERAVELADRDGGNFGNFTELVRAFEIESDKAQLHVNCGDALLEMERTDEAMQRYDKALDLAPDRWDFVYAMANAFSAAGDPSRAAQLYQAVIENDTSDPDYFRTYGKLLRNHDEYQQAADVFAQGADTHPADADLCNELGVTMYEGGVYDGAVEAYSLAIERDNQEGVYFRNRGHASIEVGQYAEALADLDRAIELDDTDAEFFFLRGKIRELAGDADGAQPDYNKAVQMDPATYRRQDRRFLQVANLTDQTITVALKYETMTTSGSWEWFTADDGEALVYELEPGQTVNVYHGEFRINARRMQIAAVTEDGSNWNPAEIWLTSQSGYVTSDDQPEDWSTYLYRFTE